MSVTSHSIPIELSESSSAVDSEAPPPVHVGDNNIRTEFGQLHRDCFTDTGGPACDDCIFVLETQV